MNQPSENAFESGQRKVIPAVLIYLFRNDDVLMIHRNSKTPGRVDYHQGKWNGLGGKLELDESPLEAAKRELWEESGVDLPLSRFKPLGTVQFPNFKPHRQEDWMVFFFTARLQEGEELNRSTSAEGDLHWVPRKDLLSLNLWPGDRHFIPFVIQEAPVVGTIWYENSEVKRHWIQTIPGS